MFFLFCLIFENDIAADIATNCKCIFCLVQDILANDDVKLDNMFLASLVSDILKVRNNFQITLSVLFLY